MFRQLGQSPPESEMKAMIDAVDADSSGTVDFEEFCLLMLRMKRAATTPVDPSLNGSSFISDA